MDVVQTVRGPVSVNDMGFCLMHEHVMASAAGIPENYPQMYRADWMQSLVSDLTQLKRNGISTVVDASPFDLGRDPKRLRLVAEQADIHIICCSGFFFELNPCLGSWTEEQIAQMQIDDLTKGIGDTGICAGMIKAVMDREGATPGRRFLHHAAGIASNETGVPVFLHSNPLYETGRYQIPLLREVGVDPSRIKLDHILETTNMDYIKWCYDQGVWLGCERIPRVVIPGDPYGVQVETRIKTAKAMIDAGMADRMIFSHDFSGVTPVFDTLDQRQRAAFDAQIPGRWLYLKQSFFPKLVEMGVEENVLYQTNVENPRKLFAGSHAGYVK